MLEVSVTEERIFIGERFSVSFQRTLRVPDSYRASKLPPGFGPLPIRRVADYAGHTPAGWKHEGAFIPLDEREAMWLSFYAAGWKPNAVKVGVGAINAVSGGAWDDTLRAAPQDYLVCPLQLWLDGINAGKNLIRQFVAAPLGEGYTVESQLMGGVETGGMRIMVFEPKPGIFPDQPPRKSPLAVARSRVTSAAVGESGVGAGGKIEQRIYPDPYGSETWDADNSGEIFIYLISRESYRNITGLEPPRNPVSAHTYTEQGAGFWFELADESLGDLDAPHNLSGVKPVRQIDAEKGLNSPDEETPIELNETQLKHLRHPSEDEDS